MATRRSTGGSAKHQEQTYQIRDTVLAKMRGFPPWPGQVVDPGTVPTTVQKERPAGKRAFYCVQFFPAGDYAWLVPKDMSLLKKHEIEAYIAEPHKKSGELLAGYRIALDPSTWEAERQAGRTATVDDEEEEGEEDDELEEDGPTEKKKPAKKRKRDSSAEPKKGRGRPRKADLIRAGATNGKKKSSKKGKKSEVESEDDKEEEPKSAPPAKKSKKSKEDDELEEKLAGDPEAAKVREWRHKLQKVFLSKTIPKAEDMPSVDVMFAQVENYQGMSIEYLQFSKIGKVMRHIAALTTDQCPLDDQFHFRDRAAVLVEKWHEIMGSAASKKVGNGVSTTSLPEPETLTAPPTAMDADAEGEAEAPAPPAPGAWPRIVEIPIVYGTLELPSQPMQTDTPQPTEDPKSAPPATEEPAPAAPATTDVPMTNGTTDADADGEADGDETQKKAEQPAAADVAMTEA